MTAHAGTATSSIDELDTPGPTGTWREPSRPRQRSYDNDDRATTGDLARAAAQAETFAWAKLVRRFDGLVRGTARAHGLNEADTADVCQAVWIRLVTRIDAISEPDRLAGWLATAARYESIRLLHQRQRSVPTADPEVFDVVNNLGDASADVGNKEQGEVLRRQIEKMPSQYRRLLGMLLCDPQPTYKEISDALAIPVGSIGPTRQRCLALLRRSCLSAGLTPQYS